MNHYETINKKKTRELNNLEIIIKKDPITKLESYDAIIIETEQLLIREKTMFIINSIVTFGLLITLFQVI